MIAMDSVEDKGCKPLRLPFPVMDSCQNKICNCYCKHSCEACDAIEYRSDLIRIGLGLDEVICIFE